MLCMLLRVLFQPLILHGTKQVPLSVVSLFRRSPFSAVLLTHNSSSVLLSYAITQENINLIIESKFLCCVDQMMVNERYFSRSIHSHYQRARSQAIAFLFTVGAKALAITAQNSLSHADTVSGLIDEAEIKQEMNIEERIRIYKRNILERKPLAVLKNSRNGCLREAYLKVKTRKHAGSIIKWKSKYGAKQHIHVDGSLVISCLGNESLESLMEVTSYTRYTEVEKTQYNSELPMIRFEHTKRQLSVRFRSYEEMLAFLQCVESMHPGVQFASLSVGANNK